MKPNPLPLGCEIEADAATMGDLASIVRFCATELGHKLQLIRRERAGASATITLHLPAEIAAAQHPAWCLACRLACFCPDARVSVLVVGTSFANPSAEAASGAAERPARVA